MTVDHAGPQAKGGTDRLDSLKLLCNSTKGAPCAPHAEFIARLARNRGSDGVTE